MVLLAGLSFALGRLAAPATPPANPITAIDGIPVGVEHTPAGALAAADNYVATEQESVEQNPARETQLIEIVDAPSYRSADLKSAAAVRGSDPAGMALWARGGHSLAVVGARRLDYYHGDTAQVTSWVADVFWGPGRPPKQGWVLAQTSLRWLSDHWAVTNNVTLPTPGPVPASTPQANQANSSLSTFEGPLAGYSTPTYGAASR